MMIRQVALLTALTLAPHLSLATETPRDVVTFSDAAASLQSGNKDKAYPALERLFFRSTDNEEKARLASVLALASPRLLTHPKRTYAWFALENLKIISPDQELRLVRIVADGAFDAGLLDEATTQYRRLIENPHASPDHLEYGTYKLGWVLMNQHHPLLSYQLWAKWYQSHPKGQLRESFLKDLTRAWLESISESNQIPTSGPSFINTQEERQIVLDGLLTAARRAIKLSTPLMLRALTLLPEHEEFVAKLAQEGFLFVGDSCGAIHWVSGLKQSHSHSVDSHLSKKWAYDCSSRAGLSIALKKEIANIVLPLPVHGKEHLAKAEILRNGGLLDSSCRESLQLFDEDFQHAELSQLLEPYAAVQLNCKASTLSPQVRTEAEDRLKRLISSPRIANASQTASSQWAIELARLLSDERSASILATELAQSAPIWKNSPLPLLTLARFREDQKVRLSLIRAFAIKGLPAPSMQGFALDEVQTALKVENSSLALDRLREFFPADRISDPEVMRLWLALASSQTLPEEDQLRKTAAVLIRASKHRLAADSTLLTALTVKHERWAELWTNWDVLGESVKGHPLWRDAVAERTLEHWSELAPLVSRWKGKPFADDIHALANFQIGNAMTIHNLSSFGPASRFSADAKALGQIRSLCQTYHALKFKVNPKLGAQIKTQMTRLRSTLNSIAHHSWKLIGLSVAANQSALEASQSLASAIETISIPDPQARAQLLELGRTIRAWNSTGDKS